MRICNNIRMLSYPEYIRVDTLHKCLKFCGSGCITGCVTPPHSLTNIRMIKLIREYRGFLVRKGSQRRVNPAFFPLLRQTSIGSAQMRSSIYPGVLSTCLCRQRRQRLGCEHRGVSAPCVLFPSWSELMAFSRMSIEVVYGSEEIVIEEVLTAYYHTGWLQQGMVMRNLPLSSKPLVGEEEVEVTMVAQIIHHLGAVFVRLPFFGPGFDMVSRI